MFAKLFPHCEEGLSTLHIVCDPFMDHSLVMAKGLVWLNKATNHAMLGYPRGTSQSEEFWRNVVSYLKP